MARILGLLFLLLVSCSAPNIAKKKTSTAVYNPLQHIKLVPIKAAPGEADSLFNTLSKPDQPVQFLIKDKSKTEFETIDVWRVQLAAVSDLDQAKNIKEKAEATLNVTSIVKEVSHLHKVFVGEFVIRGKADQFMYDVRKQGYPSAWVVPDKITIEKGSYQAKEITETDIDFSMYRVQVGSYSSLINANHVKKKIESFSSVKVIVYHKGNLYKVLAGEAKSKAALSELENTIKQNGLKTWVSNSYK